MSKVEKRVTQRPVRMLQQYWERYRFDLGVLVLYGLITLIVTYPLGFRLTTHVAGGAGDSFEHLWSMWWGKKALLDLGTSMANVSYLYHPWGTYHPLLAVTPLIQLTELPLALLFKPVVAYNLFFLSTFVLTAMTTYWLCYEMTHDRLAAFVGGVIFGFAPTRSIHGFGHLAQITTYWFPVYALAVVRYMRRPHWKTGLVTGVLLGLAALVNFVHTAYFVFIFTVYWLVYYAVTHRKALFTAQFVRSTAVLFVVAGLIAGPFFVRYLLDDVQGRVDYYVESGALDHSTNPLSFVLPSPWQPVVRSLGWHDPVSDLLGGRATENLAYLGLAPLLLAVWGIVKRRQAARFWLIFAIVTTVLSLGPVLGFGGELVVLDVVDRVKIYLPLPYVLLRKLPLFGMGRTPARIAVGTPLALAVLVSLGVTQLKVWLARRRAWLVGPVLGAIVGFIVFEYCVIFPYPTTLAETPDFYHQVREEAGEFAILDYPLNRIPVRGDFSFTRAMFYQTTHEHPIAGGRIWRLPKDGMQALPMLEALFYPVADDDVSIFVPEDYTETERVSWLSRLGFRYVVLHKYYLESLRPDKRDPEIVTAEKAYFTTLFSKPVYEDDVIIVFRVPEAGSSVVAPLAGLNGGWYDAEGLRISRWMESDGRMIVYAAESADFRLAFDALAFYQPRRFAMSVNGEPVYSATMHILQRRFVSPVFTLQSGRNEIVFSAEEPCTCPEDVDETNRDPRCLSVRFEQVELLEAGTSFGAEAQNAQFGDYVRLVGYDLATDDARPGGTLQLTLYWEVLEPFAKDYTVFTHLLDAEGQLVGQRDNPPVRGTYPTTWFGRGEIVRDEYDVPIGAGASGGAYVLQIGWYDPVSGERLAQSEDVEQTVLLLTEINLDDEE